MRNTLAALLIQALTGCAFQKVTFSKMGVTQVEFNRDMATCDYETTAATQSTDPYLRTVVGQELDRALRKNDLIKRCMLAKGYAVALPNPVEPASVENSAAYADPISESPRSAVGGARLWEVGKYARVRWDPMGLYQSPSLDSIRVTRLYRDTKLKILDTSGEWARVDAGEGSIGWVQTNWLILSD